MRPAAAKPSDGVCSLKKYFQFYIFAILTSYGRIDLYIITRRKVLAIRFEHIKVVQYNIGNGITEPKLATTDANTPVIVKTYNGPEGSLVLFNEYLCYKLAILLDIPMPEMR